MIVADLRPAWCGHGLPRSADCRERDTTFSSIEGQTKTVPKASGPPEITFAGKWQLTGGTGKWKGITGGGTYQGSVTSAGVTYQFEGEYEVKQ